MTGGVDHKFLKEGIRQQRKKYFEYRLDEDPSVIINSNISNCFVNGLPNLDIANKVIPNRILNHTNSQLQPINHPIYKFIKIETNAYLGNP